MNTDVSVQRECSERWTSALRTSVFDRRDGTTTPPLEFALDIPCVQLELRPEYRYHGTFVRPRAKSPDVSKYGFSYA
ncbi:uncharacterized protein ARMOST_17929 [Armillaria ostoyae]|uniref:Uncharacterized protein n=1 Tax=Armillaria ostoyae TaxID=47428 RepID=A0A284S0C5_ARMOS|nr:uncharacterized protein ARMOST_17929 [Armillaria ostoyae]